MATLNGSTVSLVRGGLNNLKSFNDQGTKLVPTLMTLTFDASYPTGGEDVAEIINKHYHNTNHLAVFFEDDEALRTWEFVYDKTNKKVKVYVRSTGVELANASAALDGKTVRFIVWGVAKA